jgi:hypothetical protein
MEAVRSTLVRAPFAGRTRQFQLRLGEIEALEQACGAGIGEIAFRLQAHTFKAADVWETIRLGLEGGGASEAEATTVLMRYRAAPIADYIGLAARILGAALNGVEPEAGKGEAEGNGTDPVTSPDRSKPGE